MSDSTKAAVYLKPRRAKRSSCGTRGILRRGGAGRSSPAKGDIVPWPMREDVLGRGFYKRRLADRCAAADMAEGETIDEAFGGSG